MKNRKYWNLLKQYIIKNSGLSLNELNRMDIEEFYITLTNYEEILAKEAKNKK